MIVIQLLVRIIYAAVPIASMLIKLYIYRTGAKFTKAALSMSHNDPLEHKFIMLVNELETAYHACNNDQQRRDLISAVTTAIQTTVPVPLEDFQFPQKIATKGGRRKNLKGQRDRSAFEHAEKKRLDEEKKLKHKEEINTRSKDLDDKDQDGGNGFNKSNGGDSQSLKRERKVYNEDDLWHKHTTGKKMKM